MKKIAIPVTLIMAPSISYKVTFCLYRIIAGAIINTGTIAIIVDAIPVSVFATASNENDTPKKGPKKEPVVMPIMALK